MLPHVARTHENASVHLVNAHLSIKTVVYAVLLDLTRRFPLLLNRFHQTNRHAHHGEVIRPVFLLRGGDRLQSNFIHFGSSTRGL